MCYFYEPLKFFLYGWMGLHLLGTIHKGFLFPFQKSVKIFLLNIFIQYTVK